MTPFVATVVDVSDPLEAGRIKVRAFFHHDDSIPVDLLNWSLVRTSGMLKHTVDWFQVGDLVTGEFIDELCQESIITGVIQSGESHPLNGRQSGSFPRQVKSWSVDGSSFSEPASPDDPVYPFNHSIKTASGHIIEIDDTPGAERLLIQHKTGSFTEFYPDGQIVTNAKSNIYVISSGDVNIQVDGNVNQKISGTHVIDASSHVLVGDVLQKGNFHSTGKITTPVDVVAGVISLVNHKHGGVESGSSSTSPSVP